MGIVLKLLSRALEKSVPVTVLFLVLYVVITVLVFLACKKYSKKATEAGRKFPTIKFIGIVLPIYYAFFVAVISYYFTWDALNIVNGSFCTYPFMPRVFLCVLYTVIMSVVLLPYLPILLIFPVAAFCIIVFGCLQDRIYFDDLY